MSQSNFFAIRRPVDERRRISLIIDAAAPAGLAFMRSTSDPTKAVPASGTLLGLVLRKVQSGGPDVLQRAQVWGKELELPWATGAECTLEPPPDAYEVEGDDFIVLSGTGAIDGTTTRGTKISFASGKIRVAQAGDDVLYRVGDNSGLSNTQLTADGDGPRIYLEKVQ